MSRRLLGALVVLALAAGAGALPIGGEAMPAGAVAPVPNARIDEGTWQARTDDYLVWATDRGLSQGSTHSIMAHAERAVRDAGFVWDSTLPGPEDFTGVFAKLAAYQDTGDFDINRFLFLLAGYGDDIEPDLRAALEQRVQDFKYWWTEPTPEGITDSQYYWTENHLIIFLANEYVAGQMYPTTTFSNSGMTGAEHVAHADPRIRRWLGLRARYGFSEWLSNVYWMEDLKGLLLLAEHADDPVIADGAAAVLDVMFVELAAHLQAGTFGSTHGRSYLKDKMTGLDEDTWDLAKMVFDDTAYDYQGVGTAVLLATATTYRPPELARRIATSADVAVVQQRQSLPIDPLEPLDAGAGAAAAPPVPYNDPMAWWGQGAQFPWQVVPTSVHLMQTYDLWASDNFSVAADLKPIVDAATMPQLQSLARSLARQLNPGLLSEVTTYTWRSPEVMLSTAQDWRAGSRSEQAHISQATLDANALVFVQHPADAPLTTGTYDGNSGYWTGEGALPRAAQHGQATITIYAPQYEPSGTEGSYAFGYEPYTHAYFPTEHFDEVVEQDGWTIGRLGDGYVALWSWRPTAWRTPAAGEWEPDHVTAQYELVAAGGPDDVWITQVARAADFPGLDPFGDFVAAVTSATPAVTRRGPAAGDGFDVTWASPTEGTLGFGWTGPLTVDDVPVELHLDRRWSSPWADVALGDPHIVASDGVASIDHDLSAFAAVVDELPLDAPCESWFTDIELGHPFCDAIAWLFLEGLAGGYADGGFHPTAPVSRQAMAAFLYRHAGSPDGADPTCGAAPFPDVPADHPFCGEIAWLVAEGLASGYADGGFHPAAAISRQAMAALLYRLAGSPDGVDPTCTVAAFPDVAADHPFCGEITWLASTAITGGYADGGFHPGAAVSRQATAAFLQRYDALG